MSTHHPVSFSTYAAADTKDPVLVWARRFSSPHACHSVVKASLYTQKRCPSHRQSVRSNKLNTKSSGQNKIFIANRSLLFLFIIADLHQSLGRVDHIHSDSKSGDQILREKHKHFLKACLWKGRIFGAEAQPVLGNSPLLLGTDNREALEHSPTFGTNSSVVIHVIGL